MYEFGFMLRVLLDADGGELYGEQIAARARLVLGTIYSLLARLAAAGWITSRREDPADLAFIYTRSFRAPLVDEPVLSCQNHSAV
jgi:hypothetical protein